MARHVRFEDADDVSDYDSFDSDDDYTANEQILLNKVRNKHKDDSDSENEVFNVGTDDENGSDLALSDVEGHEDDGVPDSKAWGKNKKTYYSADYVDQDYGGYQGKDAELDDEELEEGKNLQKELYDLWDVDNFSLNLATTSKKPTETSSESDILPRLGRKEELKLVETELFLIEEVKTNMEIFTNYYNPILSKYKKGQVTHCQAIEFVSTHAGLILNYCTNIHMYLLLKASKVNTKKHPISKRIYQYQQLLLKLNPIFYQTVKPQIELLLKEEEVGDVVEKTKKKLSILTKLEAKKPTEPSLAKKRKESSGSEESSCKKVRFEEKSEEEGQEEDEVSGEIDPKRPITYKIAKNKGLTPHRKKEQRNPRVKHRMKFRKAKIRRKGAIREPRSETRRYAGEMSGIKASVSKSIKIKS